VGLAFGILEGLKMVVGTVVGFLKFRLGAVVGVFEGRVFP